MIIGQVGDIAAARSFEHSINEEIVGQAPTPHRIEIGDCLSNGLIGYADRIPKKVVE